MLFSKLLKKRISKKDKFKNVLVLKHANYTLFLLFSVHYAQKTYNQLTCLYFLLLRGFSIYMYINIPLTAKRA